MIALALLLTAAPSASAGANRLEASPLAQDVSRFAASHPEASLAEVVRFANRRLREAGMNFEFDVASGPATLDAGGRELSAPIGEEEGPCGERIAEIPAVRVTKTQIELIKDGKRVFAPRPASFHLDSMEVLAADLRTVLSRIETPFQTSPHGLSRSGSILLELPLTAEAASWWRPLNFRGASPYLLFEMAAGEPRFIDDRASYAEESQPVEVEGAPKDEKNAYQRYWKFPAMHLAVRFSSPCT